MGIKQFKVEFENNVRCFFPGQMVRGQVNLDLKKKKDITGLWVKFEGKATVSWTETGVEVKNSSDSKKSRKVVYRDMESYFNVPLTLAGYRDLSDESTKTDVSIRSGKTAFPFGFTLPHGIPSSYVGKAGQVYYSVEVILRIGKANIKQRFPFTVNGILDLNHERGVADESTARKYKSVACCCFRSGPVGFLLKLPKKGYVPGEQIRFVVEISNQSNSKVKSITVNLVQTVSFYAKGNTFTDSRTIRSLRGPEVDKGEVEVWERDPLQIPPIPPTKLATCRIIDVQYTLTVDMAVTGLTSNVTGGMDIVIGTIPLRSAFPLLRPPPAPPVRNPPTAPPVAARTKQEEAHASASPRLLFTGSPPIFENYPDLPPPSYEEAVAVQRTVVSRGPVNAAFKGGGRSVNVAETELDEMFRIDDTFTPQYISYTWNGGR